MKSETFLHSLMPRTALPSLLHTEKRDQKISKEIEAEIAKRKADIPSPRCVAWEALIRLWWNQWNAAHELVQAQEGNIDCDLIHAILHRREGDYGNSQYWFAQTGESDAFAAIALGVASTLKDHEKWRNILLAGGQWRSKAMIQLVRQFPQDPLLMQVQADEFIAIARHWIR